MLDQNDIKIIKQIVDDSLEVKFDLKLKPIKEVMATKQDLADLENRMATKQDLADLENRLDIKLEDMFTHLKSMMLGIRDDLKELINTVKNMSTEDISAVNDDVQKLKRKVDKLEVRLNAMQPKMGI